MNGLLLHHGSHDTSHSNSLLWWCKDILLNLAPCQVSIGFLIFFIRLILVLDNIILQIKHTQDLIGDTLLILQDLFFLLLFFKHHQTLHILSEVTRHILSSDINQFEFLNIFIDGLLWTLWFPYQNTERFINGLLHLSELTTVVNCSLVRRYDWRLFRPTVHSFKFFDV